MVGPSLADYAESLWYLARDLDVLDRIEFIEYVADPSEQIEWSDLMLTCSVDEGFGRVRGRSAEERPPGDRGSGRSDDRADRRRSYRSAVRAGRDVRDLAARSTRCVADPALWPPCRRTRPAANRAGSPWTARSARSSICSRGATGSTHHNVVGFEGEGFVNERHLCRRTGAVRDFVATRQCSPSTLISRRRRRRDSSWNSWRRWNRAWQRHLQQLEVARTTARG